MSEKLEHVQRRRHRLADAVPALREKLNTRGRYLGYAR